MTGKLYLWLRSIIGRRYKRDGNDYSYKPEMMASQQMHGQKKYYCDEVFLPAEKKRRRKREKEKRISGLSKSQREYIDYLKDMGISVGISGGDKELRDEIEKEYYRRSEL